MPLSVNGGRRSREREREVEREREREREEIFHVELELLPCILPGIAFLFLTVADHQARYDLLLRRSI